MRSPQKYCLNFVVSALLAFAGASCSSTDNEDEFFEEEFQAEESETQANPFDETASGETLELAPLEDEWSQDTSEVVELTPEDSSQVELPPVETNQDVLAPVSFEPVAFEENNPTEPASESVYIVEPGDSLSKISARILGSASRWNELAAFNDLANPERLMPGDVIRFPIEQRSQAYSDFATNFEKKNLTVEAGDTLSSIAKKIYGSSAFWPKLWKLNEATISNPNKLSPGINLEYTDSKEFLADLEKQSWYIQSH